MTQGNIGIEAEEGRASNLDFGNSVWHFSGNVIIDVENGHIECDTADLQFADHQLTMATIVGSPATFELTRPGSEETTYAEAGKLRYNLLEGTVEFSEDATITEGGNQISSEFLIYNIVEQRINAQGSPDGDGKVRITYTPKETGDRRAQLTSASSRRRTVSSSPTTDDAECRAEPRRTAEPMSILSVQDISKSYKLRKVVKSLSLEIRSGEVVGLLGPNGAGKDHGVLHDRRPDTRRDQGNILLDGQDLTALPMHRRAQGWAWATCRRRHRYSES